MNKIKKVIQEWETTARVKPTIKEITLRLTLKDVARVRALAELYPGRTEQQIISDIVSAALDEVEEALPYVQGPRIIAEDELGDPIYEDVGATPKFERLARKYAEMLEKDVKQP